jgi:hypothetical protein
MTIPKVLHYTFGMAQDFGGKPWSLVHYACLKSAIERIKPHNVFFYCEFEPTGPWWELSRTLVKLVKLEAPREIFGRPLNHVAHRSDVLRLQKLIEHGGIYLDADVLVQKSFDDLMNSSTAMGQEGEGGRFGMANAVIVAEPNAPFVARWLDTYHTFRGADIHHFWSEHSVILPSKLAKQYPGEITVLPHTAFFWPLWTKQHLQWIFRSTEPIPTAGCYANHLWETFAWRYLEDLNPKKVRGYESNFHRWIRPFVADLPDDYGGPSFSRRVARIVMKTEGAVRQTQAKAKRGIRKALDQVSNAFATEHGRRRRTFERVYSRRLWGNDFTSPFYSGIGSRGVAMEEYAQRMADILQHHVFEFGRSITIIDLGCGDFQVGRALLARLPDAAYIGCDIVPELIAFNTQHYGQEHVAFRQLDIVSDPLPEGDICLIRQVFQHLSNTEIACVLKRLNYKYVYVTEGHPTEGIGPRNPDKRASGDVRFDWSTGRGRGVELAEPPFSISIQEMFRNSVSPFEQIITLRINT